MKVMFMGTPDFSVPVLKQLIESEKHEVTLVVTQPDRARGRGGKVVFSPVKEVAVEYGIPVFQPVKIKEEDAVKALRGYSFDVAVVVAFGQILTKEILDMPRYGCINVHASLLPRWRGAAPIQWSIFSGDEVTGVTTMLMDEGIDTGDILLMEEIQIGEKETGGGLFERMSFIGAKLLMKTLNEVETGSVQPRKQDNAKSTHAKILTKDMGRLDFSKSAKELELLIRGLNPWPSAYTFYEGKTLKIWEASTIEDEDGKEEAIVSSGAGEVIEVTKDTFTIKAGAGSLIVHELQLEGKKRMKTSEFLCGVRIRKGSKLG